MTSIRRDKTNSNQSYSEAEGKSYSPHMPRPLMKANTSLFGQATEQHEVQVQQRERRVKGSMEG
jgi:hypothetical protein